VKKRIGIELAPQSGSFASGSCERLAELKNRGIDRGWVGVHSGQHMYYYVRYFWISDSLTMREGAPPRSPSERVFPGCRGV